MAPSLPTEIWRKIFQNLCIHCQQPAHSDNQIDFTLPDAREGQAALRNLSLVSRDCRALSQDILFHHFYNLSDSGKWRPRREDWRPITKEKTPRMLRALISNPYLAEHVRMMALFDQGQSWYEGITREDLQSWSEVSRSHRVQVPADITTALDPQESGENPFFCFNQPGPMAEIQCSDRDTGDAEWIREDVYTWMYYLLVKLAPNLTHLQLAGPFMAWAEPGDCKDGVPPPSFPSVRVLTCFFIGADVNHIISSVVQFPNLDTFSCADCQFYGGFAAEPIVSAPMLNIRKLTLPSWPDALSDLLKICPHLEDLEFHTNVPSRTNHGEWHLDWPTHTKANLRRLVWSDQDSDELLGNDDSKPMLAPLTDFSRLEILGIDQASLLLDSRKSTGGISRYVLPETLRFLHVAYAQDVSSVDEISDNLRQLAAAKRTVLPHLCSVQLDHPPPSAVGSKTLAETMDASGALYCMDKAGIDLGFELEAPCQFRTSMRGPLNRRRVVPLLPGYSCCGEWASIQDDGYIGLFVEAFS